MKNIHQSGFTLVELMIVVCIITILATMTLPSYQDHVIRNQISEAIRLAEIARNAVAEYYLAKGNFPIDNGGAGLPPPQKIIGNYVSSVNIVNGVISIRLGNRVNKHVLDQTLVLRPAIVEGAKIVPISWVCGYASVPEGMSVIGSNESTILARHLPLDCRY